MLTYRCPGCGKDFAETEDKNDGLVICPACQRILDNASPEATTKTAGDSTDPAGILPYLMQAENVAPPIRSSCSPAPRKTPGRDRPAIRDGLDFEDLWHEQHAARQRRRILLLSLSGIAVVCCAVVAVVIRTASNDEEHRRHRQPAASTPADESRVADRFDPLPAQRPDEEPKRTKLPVALPSPPVSPPPVIQVAPTPRTALPRVSVPGGTAPTRPIVPQDKAGEELDPKMLGKRPPPPLHIEPTPEEAGPAADEPTIPEKIDPEVQDQIARAITLLHERRTADRVRGAQNLGALGRKARSGCRALCTAVLDPNQRVSVAAANALKQIDGQLYKLALALVINTPDYQVVLRALQQVKKMPHKGAALTPLILRVLSAYSPLLAARRSVLPEVQHAEIIAESCIRTLTVSASSDPEAVRAIMALLLKENDHITDAVLAAVPSLKHVRNGVKPLAALARVGHSAEARLAAIRALLSIAGEGNDARIQAVLNNLRFDRNPVIRQAAETALDKLSKKVGSAAQGS